MPEAATDTGRGRPVPVDAFYAQILVEGLHVGPAFQPVIEARVSRERVHQTASAGVDSRNVRWLHDPSHERALAGAAAARVQ
jgi:hypothetical protein